MLHIQFEASSGSTRFMNDFFCLPSVMSFVSESPFISVYSSPHFFLTYWFHVCNTSISLRILKVVLDIFFPSP